MTLLEFWESTRPAKHKTAPVDKLRYSTIQLCYENGWNLIDEEHPRSGKSEANNLYSVAWWLSTHPSFKFGLVTHSQALGNKFLGAVAKLLRDAGFEFEYERASEFKIKGSAGIDPSFWVSGIGGGHTGKGCHRLLLDDLLRSGSDALSDKIREGIVTDVVSTALNRIEVQFTTMGICAVTRPFALGQPSLASGSLVAALNLGVMANPATAGTSRYHCFLPQPRPLHQHFLDGAMDPLIRGNAVVPALIRFRWIHDHRGIGFEQQNLALGVQAEIDSGVVQAERGLDSLQCIHRKRTDYCRHVFQKRGVFCPMLRIVRHLRSKIVNFPMVRNRNVQRIDLPIDHHRAVLAGFSIGTSSIEILHDN